jgi:hypothetical protein
MKLVDVSPDLAVQPDLIVAIRRAGPEKSLIYTTGQSAEQGFLVEREFDELVDEVNDLLEDVEEDEADEADEENEEEPV